MVMKQFDIELAFRRMVGVVSIDRSESRFGLMFLVVIYLH